jgi:ubiquitin-conjugating enzyme E2 Z
MSKVIRKENITRLIRDVKDVLKNPLQDNGIYYKHDDTNMLKGYALIIGPADTPYENGFFFFELNFPADYPYLPPAVTYCTNANNIRFNPNLYMCGKVCLSILNTWRGDQWTSCETIRSVLLSLCGVFTSAPLLNEPGIIAGDPNVIKYTEAIEYATINNAIVDMMLKRPGLYKPFFDLFYEEMETHYRKNRNSILEKVSMKKSIYGEVAYIFVEIYDMRVKVDYPSLFTKIETI